MDGLVTVPSLDPGEYMDGVTSQMLVEYSGTPPNEATHQLTTLLSQESGEDPAYPFKNESEKVAFVFPEELVEKIIARTQFPSFFKALLFSKAWKDKFHHSNKCLTPLQQEISFMLTKETSYSPVFFGTKEIWGFDRASSHWKSMLTLTHLPMAPNRPVSDSGPGNIICLGVPNCVGSLFLFSILDYDFNARLFVTNIITRRWKELNPHGHITELRLVAREDFRVILAVLLPGDSGDFESYRVLLFVTLVKVHYHPHDHLRQITYDSSADKWSAVTTCGALEVQFQSSSVYLHGKLYLISDRNYQFGLHKIWKLCIYNVDSDKTWMETSLSFPPSYEVFVRTCNILRCGQKIMVVAGLVCPAAWKPYPAACYQSCDHEGCIPHEVRIYELDVLDLHSLQLVEVCRGPPLFMKHYYKEKGVDFPEKCGSDDHDFIYFADYIQSSLVIEGGVFIHYDHPMMTYNVRNGEWKFLPYPCPALRAKCDKKNKIPILGSAFTPGLNTFAVV